MANAQDPVMSYDEETDVLYLSLGEPRPAITEELLDGILVRLDPQTGEPVGMTIVGYKEVYKGLKQVRDRLERGAAMLTRITSPEVEEALLHPYPQPTPT